MVQQDTDIHCIFTFSFS